MQNVSVKKDIHISFGARIWVVHHRHIQRDLEASILVWAPKIGTHRSFLVQYILSSICSDK